MSKRKFLESRLGLKMLSMVVVTLLLVLLVVLAIVVSPGSVYKTQLFGGMNVDDEFIPRGQGACYTTHYGCVVQSKRECEDDDLLENGIMWRHQKPCNSADISKWDTGFGKSYEAAGLDCVQSLLQKARCPSGRQRVDIVPADPLKVVPEPGTDGFEASCGMVYRCVSF